MFNIGFTAFYTLIYREHKENTNCLLMIVLSLLSPPARPTPHPRSPPVWRMQEFLALRELEMFRPRETSGISRLI